MVEGKELKEPSSMTRDLGKPAVKVQSRISWGVMPPRGSFTRPQSTRAASPSGEAHRVEQVLHCSHLRPGPAASSPPRPTPQRGARLFSTSRPPRVSGSAPLRTAARAALRVLLLSMLRPHLPPGLKAEQGELQASLQANPGSRL